MNTTLNSFQEGKKKLEASSANSKAARLNSVAKELGERVDMAAKWKARNLNLSVLMENSTEKAA
ncbi:MAG: hypothetical protein IKN73_01305 [Alphaproteobacteria bacterium]|nr:hypothetical protein [Alphaproteobacteria bacterium]